MVDEEFEFLKNQSEKKIKNDTEIKKLAKRRVKLGLIINSISDKTI